MATPAVITDSQLEAQLRKVQADAGIVRKKLDDDQRKLDAALSERQRIVDGIARGTVKESEAPRNKVEIEQLQIRIEGYAGLLQSSGDEIKNLTAELYRRQQAATLAAREKELAARVEKGKAFALAIREKMKNLCIGDLREFEDFLGSLLTDFMDIGAREAAVQLREILFRPSRGLERNRTPEVHFANLLDDGWEPFGFFVTSGANMGTPTTRVLSNMPVTFPVVAMRPKGK
jgi:hypothetical protein